MWFKVFVLVRIPISAFCLLGCGLLAGPFVALMVLAFLVFVSIRLVQFREGAFGFAVCLFLLELVGGVAVMAGDNYFGFREYDSRTFALLAGFVGLVWALPNAVIRVLAVRRRDREPPFAYPP